MIGLPCAGEIAAKDAVVALGPWSDTVFAPLGYRIPLRAKRGYHMHYRPARTTLSVPVVDTEEGYVIAPMRAGSLNLFSRTAILTACIAGMSANVAVSM